MSPEISHLAKSVGPGYYFFQVCFARSKISGTINLSINNLLSNALRLSIGAHCEYSPK